MDNAFIQGRIDSTKKQIIAYEDAALALGNGSIQAYTLDTGQSKQTVTKMNVDLLQAAVESLYNRCTTLQARLTGNGTVIGRPSW